MSNENWEFPYLAPTGPKRYEKARKYLDSYISNELMVETSHEVFEHLEGLSGVLPGIARSAVDLKPGARRGQRGSGSVRSARACREEYSPRER
jgi:hypothetical protein